MKKNLENIFNYEGYLLNYKNWNKEIAINIATKESIKITKKHWEIIFFIRKFYLKYKITPSIRMLIKTINKKKKINIDSQYLFILFPKGPAKQASKIAGIPKSNNCL
ncbi:TusE/DsrC/DsvC family sulfur relay protein [Buchnera aphidicola (Mindarus keteleerifoliae)]|uniref:TusE/DsrC/DsvC family sulfur relay protein n=1 Tax=Buchnera aphidicola TaxID=9 RepID=UPI0031B6B4A2